MSAIVTKIKNAEAAGTYAPTAVDARKQAADFLIVGHLKSKTIVSSKISLAGPGIFATSAPGIYHCTQQALSTLKSRHTWATDF